MCGIVGYIGQGGATEVILEGLRRLEYRGYDSAGLAVVDGSALAIRRAAGKIANLEARLAEEPVTGPVGLGHTRWATHGRPCEANAHPHADCTGTVAVVHNGIIENSAELREELEAVGHRFRSETDTEVVPHLVEAGLREGLDLLAAVRGAVRRLRGAYALGVLSAAHADILVAAKRGAGSVVLGLGEGAAYLASDIPAILPYTRDMVILEDGETVSLTRHGHTIATVDGRRVERAPVRITFDVSRAKRGGYRHFMLKEIHEQPQAFADTIAGRTEPDTGRVVLAEAGLDAGRLRAIRRVVLVACGTSFHAALVGRHLVERLAGIPAEVDIASEFRYRDLVLGPDTLVLAMSQSGETADTLGAVKAARAHGAPVLGITNVVGSAISREASGVVYTHAGPEISVASTKTFTATVTAAYLVALHLGRERGWLGETDARKRLDELGEIPERMEAALAADARIAAVGRSLATHGSFLFLGRGINLPVALEGALKLKEISYLHAEGYAAGEMKHGPIALIDESLPVVAVVPRDASYDRMMGNLQEVRARDGKIIAVAHAGDTGVARLADHVLPVPAVPDLLAPAVNVIPLQLLAYHVAAHRGLDVDQPRNLAKSVTVE